MSRSKPTRVALLGAGAITLAALGAYANGLSGAFLFDDLPTIVDNPSIRQLRHALSPSPDAGGAVGRPLLNLSFAVNYALGGTQVWGYHALNVLIHVMAALTAFGLIRRTLRTRLPELALPLAFLAALLWAVHPLTTESVTAVVHRSESLMGLFYLSTLYAFVRAVESRQPWRWYGISLFACLCGMATKEVMVSAPIMVLLYDRAFVTGSFAEAWRKRRTFYLGLASTWLVLAGLVLGGHQRHGTSGFGLGVAWWAYALTQCRALTRYLVLAIWPDPLVLDYGMDVVTRPTAVLPEALCLAGLGLATLWALWRRPKLGFLGAWFFLILAPSSSVLPLATQTMAEHRMYLPLLAVMLLGVVGANRLGTRRAVPALAMVALVYGWRTARRNRDYRDPLTMFSATVADAPLNPRAHADLGTALLELGRESEAIAQYQESLRLKPDFADAHHNLGNLYLRRGLTEQARQEYQQAVESAPEYVRAWHGLGDTELRLGRVAEAIAAYQQALAITPDSPTTRFNLARALQLAGRATEAEDQYQLYLALRPDDADAHGMLGVLLAQTGQNDAALVHLGQAARLDPGNPVAHFNHAGALLGARRLPEAIREYDEALRLRPEYVEARFNLANALARAGRTLEAVTEYERVLERKPDHAETHHNLATVYLSLGRREQAKAHYERALELSPGDDVARRNLAGISSH